jgi:excisionase family DNA binding protein
MKYLSTKEVAQNVGIGRATLERWLGSGRLRAPRAAEIGQGRFRYWTDVDIERVRKYKAQNYRKGRGRKKGQTRGTQEITNTQKRELRIEAMKTAWADPEVRARRSAARKKAWAKPEVRAKMITAIKSAAAKRAKELKAKE